MVTTPESFYRDALCLRSNAHETAVELMADALADAGFERGVDVLRRTGVLATPMPPMCQMAIAGVGQCGEDV